MNQQNRDILKTVGTILLIVGVSVWGVYAVWWLMTGGAVTVRQFLPYHLAGVIPGAILRRHRFFRGLMRHLLR